MEHQRRADLMLLLATSFWGISNCLTAICLRDMQPLTLNAFRFLTAFVVLGFVFRKNVFHASRETVKYSIVVGLSLVVVYTSVTYGVIYTSVSNAGFICALSVVTTPILEFIVYRKKPEKKFGVSMILCLIGLALMTLNETLKPAFGDIICLFAAVEDAAFDIPMCGNKLKHLGTGLNSVPFHKLNKLRAELVFDPRHIRANLSDP